METRCRSILLVLVCLLTACAGLAPTATPGSQPSGAPTNAPPNNPASTGTPAASATGSKPTRLAGSKIEHIIIIMQENRSFDEYFGTYPGANGIPMQNGVPTVCLPDPNTKTCIRPYHNPDLANAGGPHSNASAVTDIDGGRMDGFVVAFRGAQKTCKNTTTPGCVPGQTPDVMGWHDARELPNYWTYAQDFVLQDAMFEPNASWSLPSHLFMVSAWSAQCSIPGYAFSCVNALNGPKATVSAAGTLKADYAWTDLTYLLHRANVSWRYYLSEGSEPDCEDDAMLCTLQPLSKSITSIWNPLAGFDTVKQDNQLANIQDVDQFLAAAKDGSLPAVAWIVPENAVSEHPPSNISTGQAYVTSLVNAVMQGPDWSSSAIFLAWDDWGDSTTTWSRRWWT